VKDGSAGFTREGIIKVEAPAAADATVVGRIPSPRFWLRVRVVGGRYQAGRAPLIDFIDPNVVQVQSLATVREETLGESNGLADQVFTLQRRPVQPDSLTLDVEGPLPDQTVTHWQLREDLLASGPNDQHFVLNATAGEVRFGDRRNGLIPVAGSTVIARRYRYGGGLAANVAADSITLGLSALSGVDKLTNRRRAEGGNDEESIEDFQKIAPNRLRHRNRAVSSDDYATLAKEVGGIGKTKALPRFHPDYPDLEVPGAVTVVVVPESDDAAPRPSQALLEAVARHLEPLRIIATELYVVEPQYVPIRVEAVIGADPYASQDEVRAAVIRAINVELDPLGRGRPAERARSALAAADEQGGPAERDASPQGRDFGLDLYPTSLFGVIQAVDHVRVVSHLTVNDLPAQDISKPISVPRNALVCGAADHLITVVPYDEEATG
jgi:predicted phage baseplate assembly protein